MALFGEHTNLAVHYMLTPVGAGFARYPPATPAPRLRGRRRPLTAAEALVQPHVRQRDRDQGNSDPSTATMLR
jgi:hypothetical protein